MLVINRVLKSIIVRCLECHYHGCLLRSLISIEAPQATNAAFHDVRGQVCFCSSLCRTCRGALTLRRVHGLQLILFQLGRCPAGSLNDLVCTRSKTFNAGVPANQLIVELLDLDMEPKPESLWWTSTHAKKSGTRDGRGKSRDVLGDAFSLRLRSVELALQEEGERDVDIFKIRRCFEQRVQCLPQRERQGGLKRWEAKILELVF